MKQIIVSLFILVAVFIAPITGKADIPMPCSSVLEPINSGFPNAKGAALVYKVKLTPSFPRTHISIHVTHLPSPSSFGDYDGFEGFAYIQNEISWRFKLYPTPEEDGPTWAGRIDIITADLTNSHIQVRLSNSKTGKLGPAVLTSSIHSCK
ncbi:hypothetical protein [Ammoniphilus sp. CFH 90114]|uniref:hypothetical protein n=1 Tax=Ammoniphilus sp. CFH 90114 TaxID=2493665 RepID=UPI00100ECFA4|nr:hypothetical protein [Ammoniphilus sp. CFH 90114]RXT02819.1 hypothetical protein EIZ39_24375 [Ammoniphilus sp. CFH 90114]